MFKKLIIAALAAVAVGAGSQSATAQKSFGGLIKTNLNTVNQGLFHVSVTQETATSAFWDVSVYFVSKVPGATVANPFLDAINVNLLDDPAPSAGPDAQQPLLTPKHGGSLPTGKVGTQVGGPNPPVTITGPFKPWTGSFPLNGNGKTTNAHFQNKNNLNGTSGLVRNGFAFQGVIQLDQAHSSPIRGAYFVIGGTGSGSGDAFFPPVTPEGASLLLLLPGLIPVAVGLRRRRLNKPAGE